MINKAFFMTGINKMEQREIPVPVPKADEILLKIEYVGICGSDVHYLEEGRIGDNIVKGDFILGHECAGTVIETGKNVSTLKKGDRVALEPGCTCGHCDFCKTGKYNLCADVVFLATPPYNGCLMNYMTFPANMAFLLPDNVSTLEGALIEPLSVGMHAAVQGGVTLGSSVVILGCGCIGLVTMLSCIAFGATDITVVDVVEKRLAFAEKLGATRVINARDADAVKEIERITNGAGVDIVFETAGSDVTLAQTPYIVKRGGRVVVVGMGKKDIVPFDFSALMWKEAELKTVFRYRNIYPRAIKAVSAGKINLKEIVTHKFEFDKTDEAFKTVSANKQDIVKAVIRMD